MVFFIKIKKLNDFHYYITNNGEDVYIFLKSSFKQWEMYITLLKITIWIGFEFGPKFCVGGDIPIEFGP